MNEQTRQKILFVDDDKELQDLFRAELAQEFEVLAGYNGEEGMVLALQQKPDLIITDINMPEMNGWEFCSMLRQIPSTRATPIVFLSSRSEFPDRIKSIRLGADDFIAKPFSMEKVTNLIRVIMGRVKNRRLVAEGDTPGPDVEVNTLLLDLLEYLRANRRSGVIEFSHLDQIGQILLSSGNITEARFQKMDGEPAVRKMLEAGSAKIAFKEKVTEKLEPLIRNWTGFVASFLPPE